jgi:isoquinoline 1-oxidoreductase beta subunit
VAPSSIPDTVHAQIQSGVIFDITAALYGQITLKDGRVEQSTSIAT